MSAPSIAERVAAGVQWLDANVPDWVDGIDLEKLTLANSCNCILGQTFGDYRDAPLLDERWDGDDDEFAARATRLGFYVDEYEEWRPLEAEWIRVIREHRRAADPLNHPVKGQRYAWEGMTYVVTRVSEVGRWADIRVEGEAGWSKRQPLPLPPGSTVLKEAGRV